MTYSPYLFGTYDIQTDSVRFSDVEDIQTAHVIARTSRREGAVYKLIGFLEAPPPVFTPVERAQSEGA